MPDFNQLFTNMIVLTVGLTLLTFLPLFLRQASNRLFLQGKPGIGVIFMRFVQKTKEAVVRSPAASF